MSSNHSDLSQVKGKDEVAINSADLYSDYLGKGIQYSESDPLLEDDGVEVLKDESHLKQSAKQAAVNIMKAVFGAGSFQLPWAFAQGGLIGGVVGIFLLGILSTITIEMIINCKNMLTWKKNEIPSYTDTTRRAVGGIFGRILTAILYFTTVVTSLGVCSAYLVVCAGMMLDVVPNVLTKAEWTLIIAIPMLLISYFPSFRYLSFTSILGDIAVSMGIIVVFIYGIKFRPVTPPSEWGDIYKMLDLGGMPRFYGTAAFLFGIHFLTIPLESSMHRPYVFQRTLRISMVIVTVLNIFIGGLGFLLFNCAAEPMVIGNLTYDFYYLPDLSRIALVLDLVFTYSILLVPGRDLIEMRVPKGNYWLRILIRSLLVGVTVVTAIFIPHFEDLVGLVSGTALSYMCFILPPILYLSNVWPQRWKSGNRPLAILAAIGAVSIGVLGLFSAILTTWLSVESVIKDYQHQIPVANSTAIISTLCETGFII